MLCVKSDIRKKKKNRLDFFQKSFLLLLLEVINVYEVVVFVYITRLVWVVLQNIMLSRRHKG